MEEPPILDWEEFQRTYIASDVRYLALFPNDPEKRARMKDLDGEHENLNEYRQYRQWAKTMSEDSETPQDRVLFYQNLTRAIQRHWIAVSKEVDELWSLASDLAQFEFRLLDNESGTSQIENSLAEGKDIFRIWGDAAREKHEYLIPSDFKPDPLKTFEDEWLDFDGGTAILERELRAGVDVLASWPDREVMRKYGDLVRLMPLLPKEDVQVTAAEKESIASGADNREGAEEEMLEPHSSKTGVLSAFLFSAKRKRYL